MKLRSLLFTLLPVLAAGSASGQTLASDYWGFSVRYSASSFLYGFTNEGTRVTMSLGLASTGQRTNHLATDVTNNRLIYAVMDSTTNAIQSIWSINIHDRVRTDITNGADLAGVIGITSGGASFYNGNYYFWDDDGDTQGLVRFTFDENGLIDGMTKPYGNDSTLGGLGDIAIDAAGIMYALNSANQLYSMDLNNPFAALAYLGDFSGSVANGQLFIDAEGRLITRQSGTDNWLSLNPDGSGILEIIAGPSGNNSLIFDDLSEGGTVGTVVPEPGGALLATLAGALGLARRRRSA